MLKKAGALFCSLLCAYGAFVGIKLFIRALNRSAFAMALSRTLMYALADSQIVLAIQIAGAVIIFFTVLQITLNRYFSVLVNILPFAYTALSLGTILFKSPGVRQLVLNPFLLVPEFFFSPSVFVLNLIVLAPIGFWFRVKHIPKRTAFLLCFLGVCAIEAIQYVGWLGVCDINDVILNTTGFIFGYLLANELSYSDFAFSKISPWFYAFSKKV